MKKTDLRAAFIQADIVWEDPEENRKRFEAKIEALNGGAQLIVLPETFNTGFSMQQATLAETPDGPTVQWMKDLARKHRCVIAGSLMINENEHLFNRMLWVLPTGETAHYDKRHLFSFGGEDAAFTRGERRVVARVNGLKICLQICYDLRFPVWARNTDDYDMLLYVANWPEKRNLAWETLLRARAIENQCFCVGVNRIGTDGKGFAYAGNSAVYGPSGETLAHAGNAETVVQYTFSQEDVLAARAALPFLQDRDNFIIL